MQWFAFLWFQLQMTKQYLQEKSFAPEQPTPDSANSEYADRRWHAPGRTLKQTPPTVSALKRCVTGSLSENLLRLIGSRFGKFANNQDKNRREAVRSSK